SPVPEGTRRNNQQPQKVAKPIPKRCYWRLAGEDEMTSSGGRTISNTRSATGLPVRPPMSGSRRRRPPARLALAAAIVAFVGALVAAPIGLAADTTPPAVTAPVISPNPAASGVTATVTATATDDA